MEKTIEKRILLGVVLLMAGIALMLRYFDLMPFTLPFYLFSWKTLLVVLGLVFIITEKNKSTGFILFAIGSLLLVADAMNMSFRQVIQFVIPLTLINTGAELNETLNDVNIFGGGEKKIITNNFKGGQLTAIFGGSEIDLRNSHLAQGINAIDITCIFGGTSIRIPQDWHVKSEVTALFGGYSDERSSAIKDIPVNPDKLLYLKGLVLFGGVEIKN
jgi:hypothetical protein